LDELLAVPLLAFCFAQEAAEAGAEVVREPEPPPAQVSSSSLGSAIVFWPFSFFH